MFKVTILFQVKQNGGFFGDFWKSVTKTYEVLKMSDAFEMAFADGADPNKDIRWFES